VMMMVMTILLVKYVRGANGRDDAVSVYSRCQQYLL